MFKTNLGRDRSTRDSRNSSCSILVLIALCGWCSLSCSPKFAFAQSATELNTAGALGEPKSDKDKNALAWFETRIRPVLIEHCYECHSGQAESVKGGLRVDWAQGLLKGGDSGPAIVAGKPHESLLLDALRYEGTEMPPSGKLPPKVIADFETWIAAGATDPRNEQPAVTQTAKSMQVSAEDLWSFQPVRQPSIPTTQLGSWGNTSIDSFVLHKLEQQRLAPIEEADLGTLVRRLSIDLTGLPPTLELLQQIKDHSSEFSVDAAIDRMLNSKAFGERWGRHWLDVARYADSNGGDFNATFHDAWRYRNYVIDALNNDMPFDRFVVEQVAGDLLPSANEDQKTRQLVATGFLMLGAKMLSERDKSKLQMDVVDEQISLIGSAFMGMTLGCARCHDHKFDPISTRDYYALAGIFKSTRVLEGEIQKYVSDWIRTPLPIAAEHRRALDEFNAREAELKKQIAALEKQIKSLDKAATIPVSDQDVVLDDQDAELVGTWKKSSLTPPFYGEGYIHDDRQEKGEKSVTFKGRVPVDGRYEVRISYTPSDNRADNVPVSVTHRDGIAEFVVDQRKKPTIEKMYAPLGELRFSKDRDVLVTISNAGTQGYVIVDAIQLHALEKSPVASSQQLVSEAPQEKQAVKVEDETTKKLAELKDKVALLNEQLKDLKDRAPPPAPLALAAQDAEEASDCQICIRGEPNQLGDVVPRGFITGLHTGQSPQFQKKSSGRLELAQWLVDPKHPLTARVTVNRIWKQLIGEGLVPSVDNFGQLGQSPSHPELLDYLASEFIAHDWSTKWLVREIVSSRVYQLSSRSDAHCESVDPENILLWRAHRKRLSAETIRDTLLMATGEIDWGRIESPVPGLGTLVTQNNANDKGYSQSSNNARTIYQPIIRNELPSLMRVFDFADPDIGTGERSETTVPAQALWMLNGPMVQAQANILARDVTERHADTDARIEELFARILGRAPTYSELKLAREFVAKSVPTNDDKPDDMSARWSDLAHAIIASSSFRMSD